MGYLVTIGACEGSCGLKALATQVAVIKTKIDLYIASAPDTYAQGYHFLSHGQGAVIARAIIEDWADHKVLKYISMAGAHTGVMYGQQVSDVKALVTFLVTNFDYATLGPDQKSVFPFTSYNTSTYLGKLQRDFADFCLVSRPELQANFTVCNLIHPPVVSLWRNVSAFLPKYNNVAVCTTGACLKAKAQRRDNFMKVNQAYFFGSPADDFLAPWQSSMFGQYRDNLTRLDELETKFLDLAVVNRTQTALYKFDTIGLRALEAQGRVVWTVVPDVTHSCWTKSSNACAWKTAYNAHVLPAIEAPLHSFEHDHHQHHHHDRADLYV